MNHEGAAPKSFEIYRAIRTDHPSLAGHFPGNPIVPGVVILEEVGRTTTGAVETQRWNESEPTVRLTLYQGLLKGAKLELVVSDNGERRVR